MDIIANLFYDACHKGQIDTAKRLYTDIVCNNINIDQNRAFVRACTRGHLLTTQWLAELFSVRHVEDWVLETICLNGYIFVARWLIEQYGLPASEDAHFQVCRYFINSCDPNTTGYMAQWIVNQYDLKTNSNLRCEIRLLFINHCSNNKQDEAQWLADLFELTDEECMSSSILGFVCAREFFALAQWLIDYFKLPESYIAETIPRHMDKISLDNATIDAAALGPKYAAKV
jgi:hypothetical protein